MRRLQYLDNLRTACMLLGVFVHTNILGNFGAFNYISNVSTHFRMATFFVLAGFFAVLLWERRGPAAFMRHRMRSLAVPLCASLVLLNPVALWLVYRFHEPGFPEMTWSESVVAAVEGVPVHDGVVSWSIHLWFLFALIAFVLATPALLAGIKAQIVGRISDRLVQDDLRPWLPVILTAVVTFVSIAVTLVLDDTLLSESWLVVSTLTYLPFFAIGMLFFVDRRLWEAVHKIDLRLIVLLAVAMGAIQLLEPTGTMDLVLVTAKLSIARCTITFALLYLFRRLVDQSNRLTIGLSRSIYTIYLFHFVIVYALANLWVAAFPLNAVAFWTIALVTCLLGYALHMLVIERVALLSLVFNGKLTAGNGTRSPGLLH